MLLWMITFLILPIFGSAGRLPVDLRLVCSVLPEGQKMYFEVTVMELDDFFHDKISKKYKFITDGMSSRTKVVGYETHDGFADWVVEPFLDIYHNCTGKFQTNRYHLHSCNLDSQPQGCEYEYTANLG